MGYLEGGGPARRARQVARLAALAGAAAVGAAVGATAWRQRRRPTHASPDTSLAGPPRAQASVPSTTPVLDNEPAAVTALAAALAPALEPTADADPASVAPLEPTADRPPLVRRTADRPTPDGDATADDPVPEGETTASDPAPTVTTAGGASAATTEPIDAPRPNAVVDGGAPSGNGAEAPRHRAASRPPVPPPGSGSGSPDPGPPRPPEPPSSSAEPRFEAVPPPADPTDDAGGDPTPAAPPPPAALPAAVASRFALEGSPAATPAAARLPAAAAAPGGGARHRRRGRGSRHLTRLRRHRARLVAGFVVVGLGIGASAGLAGVGGDEPVSAPATSAPAPTERPRTTTTTRAATGVDGVFAAAADRLSAAGTFRYEGSARATDVSDVRPMMWLSVESIVAGEVELSTGRLHEVAIGAGGRASETIAEGAAVWGRRAPLADSLADTPFALVPELSEPDDIAGRGLVMLPTWLSAATDPVALDPPDSGLPQYQATIPADVVGEVERGIEAEDLLAIVTLDDDGTPVGIELTTTISDRLHLVLNLTGVGEPVTITPPAAPPT